MVNLRKTNTTLPSTLSLKSSAQSSLQECNIPYGAAPNIHDSMFCNSRKKPLKPVISALDRKAHSEALIVSFLAEHSMPFPAAPSLIQLTQELAKDAKILQELNMGRTKASYKLCDGLANHLNEKLLQDFRKSKFSFNVDECTSNAREKFFSILVSYYSSELKRVVMQHYKSASFTIVNANNLFNYVINSLTEEEIPITNLISNLLDSTNYMRGKLQDLNRYLERKHLTYSTSMAILVITSITHQKIFVTIQ